MKLPDKFNDAEREAYQWLNDCGIGGWSVDLKDKTVHSGDGDFADLVEFAEFQGKEPT
jgi:hypothetical protein